jgi:glycosyltransferase involved in cell wall biosynthesis
VHVAFVTRSLQYGGIERQLAALARGLVRRGHRVSVLQLYDGLDFGGELAEAGIVPTSLGLRGRADLGRLARRTWPWMRSRRPDVVQGFHAESNLIALIAGRLVVPARVVWGVRLLGLHSARDVLSHGAAGLHGRLARAPDLVIANSRAGARSAAAAGVPLERLRLIRNGLDTELFRPDPAGGRALRDEWGVSSEAPLVGVVARLEPRKGAERFLAAAAAFVRRQPEARFVWVGARDTPYTRRVERLASELGLAGRVRFLEPRGNLPPVYSALDVGTLLSVEEASSNAVAEAIACEVPCVVASVGELPALVDDPRLVVDGDPGHVADAWEHAWRSVGPQARAAARQRIEGDLSLERMVNETEAALAELVRAGRAAGSRSLYF